MKDWAPSERERQAAVLAGRSVVANMRKGADDALVAWAIKQGLFVYIGRSVRHGRYRTSPWHNPFTVRRHGTRDQVLGAYREYLDHSPTLKLQLPELRGKVLGCWCYPEPCHGDILCEAVNADEA
jgi:hypothetical protein